MRIPSKHLVLATLALALAAGVGLPALRGRRVAVGALLAAVALLLVGLSAGLWQAPALGLLGGVDRLSTSPTREAVGAVALRGLLPAIVALIVVSAIALVPGVRRRHALLLALAATEPPGGAGAVSPASMIRWRWWLGPGCRPATPAWV